MRVQAEDAYLDGFMRRIRERVKPGQVQPVNFHFVALGYFAAMESFTEEEAAHLAAEAVKRWKAESMKAAANAMPAPLQREATAGFDGENSI